MKYEEIKFYAGNTIQSAVNKLLKYKKEGKRVCGSFNGIMLYSDTVTLDNAYISITGMTKKESDEKEKIRQEEYDKELQKYKEKIPTLTEEYIKKGKEILDKKYLNTWIEIVPIRLDDLYRGMELECSLEIIKHLNDNGSLEKAKEMLNSQGHSGMSYGLMKNMIYNLCERGKEFTNYLSKNGF
jgi:hypothetical protein